MSEETTAPVKLDELQPGTPLSGTVTRLVLSGAFVNVGLEKDALLHISQLGKSDFRNIEEVVKQGETLDSFVLKIDGENVSLTMVKPPALPWANIRMGETYRGTVIRIERFGAFIDIGAERPGMVHVSEMADGYVQSPDEVVRVGDVIDVRIIKLNRKKRQIDLSMKEDVSSNVNTANEVEEDLPTAMELALRKAQQGTRKPDSGSRNTRRNRDYDNDSDDIYRRTLRSQGK
jgi:small subunit ribosomal protein S1